MLKNHLKRVIVGLILGLIGGILYWRFAPKVYDGLAVVFINSAAEQRVSNADLPEVEQIVSQGASQNVVSEIDMIRGEMTFKEALQRVADARLDPQLKSDDMEQTLFQMYDVEADKDSKVATIDVKAFSPFYAADIANRISEVYDDNRTKVSKQAYANAVTYLQDQISGAKRQLDDIEDSIARFKLTHKLVELASDEKAMGDYITKLKQEVQQAQSSMLIAERRLASSKSLFAKRHEWLNEGYSESLRPTYSQIEDTIGKYEQSREDALKIFTPQSDVVKKLDSYIAGQKKLLADAQKDPYQQTSKSMTLDPVWKGLENEIATSQVERDVKAAELAELQKNLNSSQTTAATYPALERQQNQLLRDREMYQSNYFRLKHELDDINLKSSAEAKHADRVYDAIPNFKAVSPLAVKTIPTGAAIGACLFLLLSLARESLRSTVRTSSELAGVLGLPVTATVPALNTRDAQKRLRTLAEPSFVPLESFRFMASAIALSTDEPRKVLFTGVGGDVGCSTSAAEFAIACARMGVKTILVDADLAVATVSKAFGVSGKPGMRDILNHTLLPSGEGQLFLPTEHKNLSILPAGSAEGLGIADVPMSQLAAVLESLEPHAQLVVVDCPPFDVLADASRFVPLTDEACLVVSAKKTNLQAILIAEKLMERAGAHTISIILTEASAQEEAFSRHYRYMPKSA
jgi:tyrosine-protein kinase Etk/Wzc